jgi:serine-type D-Ala-D-Ala carboxypeptidase/endopeptidase
MVGALADVAGRAAAGSRGQSIMAGIVEPTQAQVEALVAPYLATQPSGLGFAIGYAGTNPSFKRLRFAGNVQNQFGGALTLDANTPFEIASLTKTFTATLYALLIRGGNAEKTVGDCGLPIDSSFAQIKLDQLVNYTSGLQQDNSDDSEAGAVPRYWPMPYSMAGLMGLLKAWPPDATATGYTYSNLAFAIMSAILAVEKNGDLTIDAFVRKMHDRIFVPLDLKKAMFFDDASLATLPLGYNYNYTQSTIYEPWQPGWALFPAYFGAAGIVATPNDMLAWLLFNMGITQKEELTPLLPALHQQSTPIKADGDEIGLGWFINSASKGRSASISKDGGLWGFSSYMAFLPSDRPGKVASQAGAFVLVNAGGITASQTKDGADVGYALTNDLLLIMQGQAPLAERSILPSGLTSRSRGRGS